jgi:hypothetical protein
MAKDTSSGSFDSTSLLLRSRVVPLRKTGIKFSNFHVEIKLTHYRYGSQFDAADLRFHNKEFAFTLQRSIAHAFLACEWAERT